MLHAGEETDGKRHRRGLTFDRSFASRVSQPAVAPCGAHSTGRAPAASSDKSETSDKRR